MWTGANDVSAALVDATCLLQALDMYQLLRNSAEDDLQLLPPELASNPAAKCPSCHKSIRGLTCDACFKACRLAGNSSTKLEEPFLGKHLTVTPDDLYGQTKTPEALDPSKQCSTNYKAGNPAAKRRTQCDVQAIGAVACRHSVVIEAWPYPRGETYGPYIQALSRLAQHRDDAGRHLIADSCVVCIDIACRIRRFVNNPANNVPDNVKKLVFCTGKFHCLTHSFACQVDTECTLHKGAANQSGEMLESVFAVLGKGSHLAKYFASDRFFNHWDNRIEWFNNKTVSKLSKQLLDSAQRAINTRARALSELSMSAKAAGFTEEPTAENRDELGKKALADVRYELITSGDGDFDDMEEEAGVKHVRLLTLEDAVRRKVSSVLKQHPPDCSCHRLRCCFLQFY